AELLSHGQLLASGPLPDSAAGLLILRAADPAGAQALVAADPIRRAGLVDQVTIQRWNPNLGPFMEG
ncbi:MAG: YciI family protein, partial [Bifidobacteriaceae bacterium]|nr:YciI family protein [Bifidobacteriaceae bacterium]